MGRMRRWFGKEHNPERANLVRRSIRWMMPADGVAIAGAWLWIDVSPFAGVPLIAAGIAMFVISIRTLVAATRLPHWDSPREGAAADAA